MSKYTVKFYTGDYPERQEAANKDGAICYVEHHFNSKEYDDPKATADNPIMTIVAHDASATSKSWASLYSSFVQKGLKHAGFDFPLFAGSGVLQREFKERGDYNLRFTKMPAILVEPMWLSDIPSALALLGRDGRKPHVFDYLAAALADSVKQTFPDGGLVAASIGHMGKTSQPFDRGAPITSQVDNPEKLAEAHLAHDVMKRFETLMTAALEEKYFMPVPEEHGENIKTLAAILLRSGNLTSEERRLLKKIADNS